MAGGQDRGVEIRDAAVHEAQNAVVETGLDHQWQIEDRIVAGVPDHDQEAACPPRLADRRHPDVQELARLIDVHRELRAGIDRRPAGGRQVAAIEQLDAEAPSRERPEARCRSHRRHAVASRLQAARAIGAAAGAAGRAALPICSAR